MPLCSFKSQGSFRALNEMCNVKQRFIFPVWFFSGLHHLRSLSTSLHRSACHSCHKRKKNWKREICRRRLHYNSGSFHSSERPRNSGLLHKWYFVFSVEPVVFAVVVVACLLTCEMPSLPWFPPWGVRLTLTPPPLRWYVDWQSIDHNLSESVVFL